MALRNSIILFIILLLFPTLVWAQSLTVTWNDESTNEEGFIVERGDIVVQPDGTLLATNFVEVSRPPVDAVSHVDNTIAQGRFYCYRVAAFLTVTNATPPEARSIFSNIGCGMNITIILGIVQ